MTKATIIIVTHNRPNYLRRILDYYNECQTDFKIVVSDSSSEENKIKNKNIISLFPKLDISYLGHYLDKIHDFRHQLGDSVNYVKTKYCVFCGDDDFITPGGINQSVDFLDHNLDFTIAHGRFISFYLKTKKNREKNFHFLPCYSIESIIFSDPKIRLVKHLSDYSVVTHFSVYRTDFLKMIFKEMLKFTNDERFSELLPSMLTLIYGKMKCLDLLYCAREIIPNSAGIINKRFQDFIDDGSYDEKYTMFKKCLVTHLSKNSRLGSEKSKMLIDRAMAVYLKKYNPDNFKYFLINKMKNVLSYLPKNASQRIRLFYMESRLSFLFYFSKRNDNFSASLNDPSSKYFDDFNKIKNCAMSH